jgi:hypothetical protein
MLIQACRGVATIFGWICAYAMTPDACISKLSGVTVSSSTYGYSNKVTRSSSGARTDFFYSAVCFLLPRLRSVVGPAESRPL